MLKLVEDPHVNHVRQMAIYFNAELDEGNDASMLTMDNGHAKGFISSYQLFPGITVWVYNIVFRSDFKVLLELSRNGPFYFSYNVKGYFLHRFLDEKEYTDILQNQNMIVIGSPNAGVEIIFPANENLEIAVIVLDMALLGSVEARNAKRIHQTVQMIFDTVYKKHSFRHLGSIDTQTKIHAAQVCENKNTGLIGSLRTEGAVLNMLASQIHSYTRNLGIVEKTVLRKSELSRITSLEDYVMGHLNEKHTVAALSSKFGLSSKKLQIGVKFLYGNSVGNYITNLRIGEAKRLLETTNLSCSEVSFLVGFSSQSYFSKLFKNRHGILPSLIKFHKREIL